MSDSTFPGSPGPDLFPGSPGGELSPDGGMGGGGLMADPAIGAVMLGSFLMPGVFSVSELPSNKVVSRVKLPRVDGARIMPGILDEKKFVVKGTIIKNFQGSGLSLRGHLDQIKLACNVDAATLQLYSDRYWRDCHVEGFSESYDPTWQYRIAGVSFDVITGDPFQYETVNQSIDLSTGSGTVAAGGSAYAVPVISITFSMTGPFTGTFTNTTTGDAFTIIGNVMAGQTLAINSQLQSVTISGVDNMFLFDGSFPRLFVGANMFTTAIITGAISNMNFSFQNRYF